MLYTLSGIALALFVGIVYYFLSKSKGKPINENELQKSYSTLYQLLFAQKNVQSEQLTKKSIVLRIREHEEEQTYTLIEVEGKLSVVWTLNSKTHGKRGKEWSFDANTEQEKMFEEISREIIEYKKTLFRER